MSNLVLRAKLAGHNKRHVRVAVYQNHGNTGALVVEREHVAEVLGIINAGQAAIAACRTVRQNLNSAALFADEGGPVPTDSLQYNIATLDAVIALADAEVPA